MTEAQTLLDQILSRLPGDERSPLLLGPDAAFVAGTRMTEGHWLFEQVRLRARRWSTDDRRVLATLWWYSASVWTVAPTLASLVLCESGEVESVLSAAPDDLALHWVTDSRITGATSSRVLPPGEPIQRAGASIRDLYESVIPLVAEIGGMRERPLWAIAADSLAGRLSWLDGATGAHGQSVALLEPLGRAIGGPLPLARFGSSHDGAAHPVHRVSCCLLYLAPRQSMCGNCPRKRSQDRRARADEIETPQARTQ